MISFNLFIFKQFIIQGTTRKEQDQEQLKKKDYFQVVKWAVQKVYKNLVAIYILHFRKL